MKALSIREPWASLVMAGKKQIENRVWYTPYLGPIVIHASAGLDMAAFNFGRARDYGLSRDMRNTGIQDAKRTAGHILGTAQIRGIHKAGDPECRYLGCHSNAYAEFPKATERPIWHWEIVDPRPLVTPIPAKGSLRFWEVGPSDTFLLEIGPYA